MNQKRDNNRPISRNPLPEPPAIPVTRADPSTLAGRKIVKLTDLRKNRNAQNKQATSAVFNLNSNSIGKGFSSGVSGQLNLKPQNNSLNFFTGALAVPEPQIKVGKISPIKNDLFSQFIQTSKSGSGLFEGMMKQVKQRAAQEDQDKAQEAGNGNIQDGAGQEQISLATQANAHIKTALGSGLDSGVISLAGPKPNLFQNMKPASKLFPNPVVVTDTQNATPKISLFNFSNKKLPCTTDSNKQQTTPITGNPQPNTSDSKVQEKPKVTEVVSGKPKAGPKTPAPVAQNVLFANNMPTFGSKVAPSNGLFGSNSLTRTQTQNKPHVNINTTGPLLSSAPQPKKGGLFSGLSKRLQNPQTKKDGLFASFGKTDSSGLFSQSGGMFGNSKKSGLFSNNGNSQLFGNAKGGFFKNTDERVEDADEEDAVKEEAPVEVDESKIEKQVEFKEYYEKVVILPVANFKEQLVGSNAPQDGFSAGSVALEREITEQTSKDNTGSDTLTIVFRNRAKLVKHQSLVIKGVSGYCVLKSRNEAIKIQTYKMEKGKDGQMALQKYFVKILFNEASEAKKFTGFLDTFLKQ